MIKFKPKDNNSNKKKYYVYILINSLDNQIFYVGKGCGHRMYSHEYISKSGKHYNTHLSNKILKIIKNGGAIITKKIHKSDNENYIYKKEIEAIKKIGLEKLCNKTLGGEGSSGMKHSKEYCNIISERMKNRTVSEQTKLKISLNHYDVSGKNNPMYNKNHTEKTRKKISDTRKKMKPTEAMLACRNKPKSIGSKNPNSFLNEKKVLKIRMLFSNNKNTRIELQEKFNITKGCLSKLLTRRTWKHI
jgi:hypothetical protein